MMPPFIVQQAACSASAPGAKPANIPRHDSLQAHCANVGVRRQSRACPICDTSNKTSSAPGVGMFGNDALSEYCTGIS